MFRTPFPGMFMQETMPISWIYTVKSNQIIQYKNKANYVKNRQLDGAFFQIWQLGYG